MNQTIIITGSSGLVGSALVSHFSKLGFQIRAFQRSIPENDNPLITYHKFDLADVQDQGFEGANFLIHCAYRPVISKHERESGINTDIEGTKKIITFCRKHNVKIIFLSTLSAHPASRTYYAKNKLLMEKLFDTQKDLILKLGIVLGQGGGLFGRIASSIKKHKVVPLIGGGRQLAQTIALDDLCKIIEVAINRNMVGNFMVAYPGVITMLELYKGIAKVIKVKPLFIPIPWIVAYLSLQLAENIGLRLPFTSQNVLGLRDFKTFNTVPDLNMFGLKIKDHRTTFSQLSNETNIHHQKQ